MISPLLSNIYLHLLDRLWAKKCGSSGMLIRYADDFVVMCTTESKAKEALRQVQFVMSKLGLVLHPDKDADGELEWREGELCILGLHDSKEAEHTAESAAVLHAAVAVAQGDEENPETRA